MRACVSPIAIVFILSLSWDSMRHIELPTLRSTQATDTQHSGALRQQTLNTRLRRTGHHHHQPPTNHQPTTNQPPPTTINHHHPPSTTTNHHQPPHLRAPQPTPFLPWGMGALSTPVTPQALPASQPTPSPEGDRGQRFTRGSGSHGIPDRKSVG